MYLIIAITNIARITVPVITIIIITNVGVMVLIWVIIVRELITASRTTVLIMANVITAPIHTIVHVI